MPTFWGRPLDLWQIDVWTFRNLSKGSWGFRFDGLRETHGLRWWHVKVFKVFKMFKVFKVFIVFIAFIVLKVFIAFMVLKGSWPSVGSPAPLKWYIHRTKPPLTDLWITASRSLKCEVRQWESKTHLRVAKLKRSFISLPCTRPSSGRWCLTQPPYRLLRFLSLFVALFDATTCVVPVLPYYWTFWGLLGVQSLTL